MTRPRYCAALRLVAAGLFMVVTGWPAAAPGSTTPGSAAPTPAPTTTQTPEVRPSDQPTVDVEIVTITPQVLDVTSEEHVTVVARITNTSTTTITSGQATLSLAARNMRSRAEVDGWTAGTLDLRSQVMAEAGLSGPLEPGAWADVTLADDRTARQMLDDGTLVNEWGPRGLVVEVAAGSTTGEVRTFLLVKSNQDIPEAPVALLAALTGPPVTPTLPEIGDSTARPLDGTTSSRVEQVVEAVAPSPQVGLALDPALVTEDSSEVLAEVQDGQREVLTLPWGDPDLQALSRTQTWDLLTQARRLAAAEPDQAVVWSVDPVDDETVAAVRATGADWIIAPSSSTRSLTQASTQDGDLTVLRPDETVSALFDGSSGLSEAEAQQQALALLATAARGTDRTTEPEPVLVTTGRGWEADADWTQSFVAALGAAPWVRLTTTTDLTAGTSDLPAATTGEPTATPDVGLDGLAADRDDLAKFATVTESPALVTGGVDQAALLAWSYAWRADPDGQSAAVAALRLAVGERRDSLYLTKRTDLTLITKKGDVRFNIRNDLPVAATVRVRLEPTKPCLRGDSRSTLPGDSAQSSTIRSAVVTAPPHSDTPVAVTLYAQANCQVTVRAELVGTDGAVVTTDPVEFDTTVRAQLEVVGTTVVGVLLGISLVLGVVRTVRRGQSARRGDRTTTDPVRLGVLGGETPIAGIPTVGRLTPTSEVPAERPPEPPDETT